MTLPKTDRDWFVWRALSLIDTWYSWGGDDPTGFDCSGLVVECGKSVGLFPRQYDNTARGIYAKLKDAGHRCPDPNYPGVLVFWGKTKKKSSIYHVEIVLDGDLAIGASGGTSRTRTRANAIRDNAYIKIRPIASRRGPRFYVDPFDD